MWYEVLSYDPSGKLLAQQSSGVIADGEIEDTKDGDAQRWLFRDRIFDQDGQPVHMFWQAAKSAKYADGYEIGTMRTTTDPLVPHYEQKTFQLGMPAPARIVAHLRIRPMGTDVLKELVDTGYLDPAIPGEMPTFTLKGSEIEWKTGDGNVYPNPDPTAAPTRTCASCSPAAATCDAK